MGFRLLPIAMTMTDLERPFTSLTYVAFPGLAVWEWIKTVTDPYYQRQKDSNGLWISLITDRGHDVLRRQISRKWYKIELYIQW